MHTALVYFMGPAGSGKSTMVGAFNEWLEFNSYDSVLVNLDPGALTLPYEPDIDIRERIRLEQVMKQYDLGPNGAQVVCADMLALQLDWLKEALDEARTNYILVDTPGQMELFLFREAAHHIVQELSDRSMLAMLFDPLLSRSANGFVTQLMLANTAGVRFPIPQVPLLSKVDLLEPGELDRILLWSKDLESLWLETMDGNTTMDGTYSQEILKVLRTLSVSASLIAVSSLGGGKQGMDDLYTAIQMAYGAGEDLVR